MCLTGASSLFLFPLPLIYFPISLTFHIFPIPLFLLNSFASIHFLPLLSHCYPSPIHILPPGFSDSVLVGKLAETKTFLWHYKMLPLMVDYFPFVWLNITMQSTETELLFKVTALKQVSKPVWIKIPRLSWFKCHVLAFSCQKYYVKEKIWCDIYFGLPVSHVMSTYDEAGWRFWI